MENPMRMLLPILLASGVVLPASIAYAQEAPSDGSPHGMFAIGARLVPVMTAQRCSWPSYRVW
ncbi:hypothetical protein AM571_PA00152 (plasmid) [Rhizobium etli 8C-3]|uniref:Uncharacterized protein n=1 Tax=Rhizobium etli 8C-3 TaxID=538025 RepID=A0A1L5PA50_RHIET|nr:hypothetical protein AM571_PA00152 [Rhizobium etli 8C-3]